MSGPTRSAPCGCTSDSTNGESGTAERFRDLSTTIEVPNNGIPLPTVCGRVPLEPGALTVDRAESRRRSDPDRVDGVAGPGGG